MRLCEVCFKETPKENYCSKPCALIGERRSYVYRHMNLEQRRSYVNRHNKTIFAHEGAEGDIL